MKPSLALNGAALSVQVFALMNILITGGSGGIALATASKLRAEQHRVVLVSRQQLSDSDAIVADVSTSDGARAALSQASVLFGGAPQGLIHAAGNTLLTSLARTREDQYRQTLAANLDSAFFTLQAWLDALGPAPGSAVLFSSVVARVGVGNHAAIAAAKAGVEALARSVAAEVSERGVRVNVIAPGLVRTPMTERLVAGERGAKAVAAQYPLGRFGEADDAAELAAFLVSPRAAWITGQVIGLDGGFTAVRPMVRSP